MITKRESRWKSSCFFEGGSHPIEDLAYLPIYFSSINVDGPCEKFVHVPHILLEYGPYALLICIREFERGSKLNRIPKNDEICID